MENVMRLRRRGHLTEQQVLTADKFRRNPNAFRLSPTLFGILRELILEDVPLETFEADRGWPARSAKVILGVLLYALEETKGIFWAMPAASAADGELQELVGFLTGDDIDGGRSQEWLRLAEEFGFTEYQARIFLILRRANREAVHREVIYRRLYWHQIDDGPDLKGIDVQICYIRKKLEGSNWEIQNVFGFGYRLVDGESKKASSSPRKTPSSYPVVTQSRDRLWKKLHECDGLSMREISRQNCVSPSTVMRGIKRAKAAG